ncbi:hypothetical protein OIE66_23060 [Nonomuraea sp. NBC_01738]|uniref:hypothetical protein n=1 Tax=Nonomuraea sp. NBC_01738 TaxID=2976003 RepID=UPI002E0F081B|nr:hypothetical protein OIE66_23060 [Nonomuraea sp. NBC_01738]
MIEDLLHDADALPYGHAKTALLEQALREAEAGGDAEEILAVRMELTEAYQFGSEPAKSFATFSRCVAAFDADPSLFGEWQAHTLLWQYKWIMDSMRDFPEIPLKRAHDALDEMERRYREAGVGLHAVHTERCAVAEHVGDMAAAEEYFHRWTTTPRDEMSDCAACDPDGKVVHLSWTGRDEEAVALAAPVLSGQLTCESQPHGILSTLLLPYVRTGRYAEAAQAHLKAYRLIQASAHHTSDLDLHLEFCARTGNESRGLEILQRELPRMAELASPRGLMTFLAAAGLLLRRLEDLGHGDMRVPLPATLFTAGDGKPALLSAAFADGETGVSGLRAAVTAKARELAAAFDARNGTAEQSTRVETRLAAQPLVEHVPLLPHARRVVVPAAAPVHAPVTATPDELLDAAEDAWRRSDLVSAFAAWARYDEAGGSLNGRRADGLGLAAAGEGDLEAAARHWQHAADLHAAAGDEAARQGSLGRYGMVSPDGLALVEESHRYLATHGTEEQRRSALSRLAQMYAMAGRTDEALALLREATSGALLALRAQLEEPGDAVVTAGRARQALREEGDALQLARTALLHGQLMWAQGSEPGELIAAFTEVLRHAPAAELHLRAVAHASRGGVLLAVDQSAEAADDLIEAVALFTAAGAADNAALARVDLAKAYLATDRPVDAAITAEEALGLLDPDDLDNRQNLRWTRANALRRLGEGAEVLDDLLALAAEITDPWQAAAAADLAAQILDELDRDDEAAHWYGKAAQSFLACGEEVAAGRMMRKQALSLHFDGEAEAALEAAAKTRAFLSGLTGEEAAFELAAHEFNEARMLAGAGRLEEAAERCRSALEGFRAVGHEEAAQAAAELLEEL